jgi:hypothetical protein
MPGAYAAVRPEADPNGKARRLAGFFVMRWGDCEACLRSMIQRSFVARRAPSSAGGANVSGRAAAQKR